jgi:hypothetical protein
MALLKEEFRERIQGDPEHRHWALLVVFGNQTEDEQEEEKTKYPNHAGFNTIDAKTLTRLAKEYLAGKTLAEEDETELNERLPKYFHKQILPTHSEDDFVQVSPRKPPTSETLPAKEKKETA